VDDATIRDTIVRHANEHGELFCPHTATAVHVLDTMGATGLPWAIVATAHPAKFDSVVEPLLGRPIEMPAALQAMLDRPASAEPLAAEDEALKRDGIRPSGPQAVTA
jgi:threonine synthase